MLLNNPVSHDVRIEFLGKGQRSENMASLLRYRLNLFYSYLFLFYYSFSAPRSTISKKCVICSTQFYANLCSQKPPFHIIPFIILKKQRYIGQILRCLDLDNVIVHIICILNNFDVVGYHGHQQIAIRKKICLLVIRQSE